MVMHKEQKVPTASKTLADLTKFGSKNQYPPKFVNIFRLKSDDSHAMFTSVRTRSAVLREGMFFWYGRSVMVDVLQVCEI